MSKYNINESLILSYDVLGMVDRCQLPTEYLSYDDIWLTMMKNTRIARACIERCHSDSRCFAINIATHTRYTWLYLLAIP